jgi:type I restriction enzyme S subunit
VVDWDEEFSIFVSLCLLRPKEFLLTEYLAEALNSKYVQDQFLKRSKQGTVTNLHLIEIRECRLPIPSKVAQRDLVHVSSSYSAAILSLRKHRDMMISLRRAMVEPVLKQSDHVH